MLLFFPRVPDMKTNLHFLISQEWFCILSLQVTRYTDPGDIWRKLKLRGEDTRPAAPSTSSDGQPEEESRLNVSIPSFFFFHFSVPHSFPRHVRRIWSYWHFHMRQKRNKLLLITIIIIGRPRLPFIIYFEAVVSYKKGVPFDVAQCFWASWISVRFRFLMTVSFLILAFYGSFPNCCTKKRSIDD